MKAVINLFAMCALSYLLSGFLAKILRLTAAFDSEFPLALPTFHNYASLALQSLLFGVKFLVLLGLPMYFASFLSALFLCFCF